ncbi:hypothetical protein IJJ36_03515 [Candidatus Saccharibacteria bacterium]|nr:hypothetical protein [Candidatus Saccharibacteria bacterium]
MTEKTKKDNKNLIICICAAVVVVVIAIIAIVFATKGSAPIDDSYFVSDDSKYVISLTSDNLDYEDDEYAEYAPLVSHVVYYYSGDKITGMKTYHEYENADAAKEAYDALKASGELDGADVSLNGKYFVITNDSSEYEDLTASDVQEQIELMEMFQNMDSDDIEDEE